MADHTQGENPFGGADENIQDLIRRLLNGEGELSPEALAKAAGLPDDPATVAGLMSQLRAAMSAAQSGRIDWAAATTEAERSAAAGERQIQPVERASFDQATHLADLWLDEATAFATTGSDPRLMTRRQWVSATMAVWTELAEPVATSIADALTDVMRQEAPPELGASVADAGLFLRSVGGSLFAVQLGHVVGSLSGEVLGGGEIGIPLLDGGASALLPQNIANFAEGLDVSASDIALYLTIRERAHARLFRNARWLRLGVLSTLTEVARGVRIDPDRMREIAENFDPQNAEALREALGSGSLIPPKSPEQIAALARLEDTLALIEGWVDIVTEAATRRLPTAGALGEAMRRRRAVGGPAESAFGALVGLTLRPRRFREAAALWRSVGDAVGNSARDALWQHPDIVPSPADLNDPAGFIAKLTGSASPSADEVQFDAELAALFDGNDETDCPPPSPGPGRD